MAKEAPKPKKAAAKTDQPKAGKPVAQKAVKAAAKTAKPAPKAVAKTAKPAVKTAKAAAKAMPQAARKAPARGGKGKANKVNQGDQLYCDVCGLIVTVDEECGCAACDIICCGTEMQVKK